MLQSKRAFVITASIVALLLVMSVVLIVTKNTTINYSRTIPSSPELQSLPPQASGFSDYTSVISGLPISISYAETRTIQESVGYLANPEKKGENLAASYRSGSEYVAPDGSEAFLVDVPSVQKTFVIYSNERVECASQSQQKEASWRCEMPKGAAV